MTAMTERVKRVCPWCGESCARAWCGRCERVLPPVDAQKVCDHKFIDSRHCLKCGWTPDAEARGGPRRGTGMRHELKCWPDFYGRILTGEKTFELRLNDRDYHGGDRLWLREWDHTRQEYTGRDCLVEVPYLLAGDWPGLMDGFVVMSIRLAENSVKV